MFSTVVSQHNFWVNYGKGQPDEARFTRLLLERGADPNVRASIRARLGEGHGGGPLREYRDLTNSVGASNTLRRSLSAGNLCV